MPMLIEARGLTDQTAADKHRKVPVSDAREIARWDASPGCPKMNTLKLKPIRENRMK